MFLTPQGEPFWGGTYFPPDARYGRPGFRDVLEAVHRIFRAEPEKVEQNRTAITGALAALSRKEAGGAISLDRHDALADRLLGDVDPVDGGIGHAPKFPQVSGLELMWRAWCRNGDARMRDAATGSARAMCQGGIYDHLGGGFARYATDDRWLVPHFEKMLYDNALLLGLLTQLWQDTREPLFRRRVEETVDWALREMIAPEGGFASAFDADSEGEEGRYYTWAAEEIDRLLGADATIFKAAYDVRSGGNWEGRSILNRSNPPADGAIADEDALAAMRAVLLAERAERVPPGRDDKVLADWNGLMIAALAAAGAAFDRAAWISAAGAAFDFVCERMTVDGRLRHSYRAGAHRGDALLDDYANMARAALVLFEVTAEDAYLGHAEVWAAEADARYWDGDGGGYFYTAADAERLIVRTKTGTDSAVPSGNAIMVEVLARLHLLTARTHYRERADAVIAAFSKEALRHPLAAAALINANELLLSGTEVVVVGESGAAQTDALLRAAYESPAPNRVLLRAAPGDALPDGHPAAGKGPVDGMPAAYVCTGMTCSLPITSPAGLRAALAPRAASAQ
jgi:uncharacterized protein YyaL (SSP411 family)